MNNRSLKTVLLGLMGLVAVGAAFWTGYRVGQPDVAKLRMECLQHLRQEAEQKAKTRPETTNAVSACVGPRTHSAAARMAEARNHRGEGDAAKEAARPQLEILTTRCDEDDSLIVYLSEKPDVKSVRDYVGVGPLRSGTFAVNYLGSRWCEQLDNSCPALKISGDFAFQTNVTLRIRKGLPMEGTVPSAEGALTNDYVYVFRRKNLAPAVGFVAKGRYLPPTGKRLMEVETVNVSNVLAEVRRIEPRNVVQLLAREERVYDSHWRRTVDEEDTEELSGDCTVRRYRCENRLNEKERNFLTVEVDDEGPTNGMYLVMIRNDDLKRNESRWWGDFNPNNYRVVCVSDLGISVRECEGGVGVWVTSLTTGVPVTGAKVEVYSSANTKIAEGTSDANGWCVPARCAKGEAFAVVVRTSSGDDMTFLALRDSMVVEEDAENGARPVYLSADACTAFLWTERGIYRHEEKIFVHGIFRTGAMTAPKPMPVELVLRSPDGKEVAVSRRMTDENGVIVCEDFSVPAERPSGNWMIWAKIPGKDGEVLGTRPVKIEEFAPPQIRVRIAVGEGQHPSNLTFRISAEHLFGGPACLLDCQGAVVFEDVAFAPAKWKGWHFGNETLGLKPCYRELARHVLDDKGECDYPAPLLADSGMPKAAVKATVEGTVFEDGGRPATSRKSLVCHCYPHYIGSNLKDWMRNPANGKAMVDFVLVDLSGERVSGVHSLTARLERVESVYTYHRNSHGEYSWDCDRVNQLVVSGAAFATDEEGHGVYELPTRDCGDYVLTVSDGVGGSFARRFYLSDWGDEEVRAKLTDPTDVTLTCDKTFYRVGETPRLLVKSPFPGWAMLSVMREKEVYSEIVNLTNATSEITLRPVVRDHAPNLEVYLSVVKSVSASTRHLAARAHGQTTVAVRPVENELTPTVRASLQGTALEVEVEAKGASYAVVTVVDEGINLLTEEKTPDPRAYFAQPRRAWHPLYDIFGRVLPVVDGELRMSGVKTGGDVGAEMLGRVSPEPSRRFKPLALWKSQAALCDGKGRAVFELPEFAGEIRVTAVVYSDRATGATSVQKKIAPNLIMQPDAPRFVAPGDTFTVTMPLRNMTEKTGTVEYEIMGEKGTVVVEGGAMTNIVSLVKAPAAQGQLAVRFVTHGLGEAHQQTIEIPVRPAVAWRETAGIARVEDEPALRAALKEGEKFAAKRCTTPTDELVSAYRWLADYPHGCLEQTSSRIFPLLSGGLGVVSNRAEYVAAGVRRVESMIRTDDFVMWPDCNYAPWDREVSLYAAHFLVEAERSGVKLSAASKEKVLKFLAKWALATNDCVSAYACHDLALAGKPDRDRMLRLYDRAESLDALSRARLARAFALDHDFKRAEKLLAYAYEPQSIREAAFTVLAMLEVNPDDARICPIVDWLMKNRQLARYSWGTTGENAHALLAIGAYFKTHPGEEKKPYLLWRKLSLPEAAEVKDESSGLFISRSFRHANGEPADLADLVRGEMLIVRLSVTSDVTRVVNDLVIEDLFPAAFEPVHTKLPTADWVMRSDARDDRMLVFSKRFTLEKGNEAVFDYPVRVVTAGDFVLPGPSVEGMYNPELHALRAPGRLVVRR